MSRRPRHASPSRGARNGRPSPSAGDASINGVDADQGGRTVVHALSLNLWDTPFVGKDRGDRVAALRSVLVDASNGEAAALRLLGGHMPDVIGLQEVFVSDTFESVKEAASAAGLPYVHRFLSGTDLPARCDGAGVAIVSRWPIINAAFFPYAVNGRWQNLHHWDQQVGKGIGLATLRSPAGPIDVYTSHLVSQYADADAEDAEFGEHTWEERDHYLHHRVAQAFEAGHFIRLTSRASLTLMLTDLNANPDSLAYKTVCAIAGLSDSFADANPDSPSAITFGGDQSRYANASHPLLGGEKCDVDQRLDYCLYRASGRWKLEQAAIALSEPVDCGDGKSLQVSDHFGMTATFSVTDQREPGIQEPVPLPPASLLGKVSGHIRAGAARAAAKRAGRTRRIAAALLLALLVFEGSCKRAVVAVCNGQSIWDAVSASPPASGLGSELPLAPCVLLATLITAWPLTVYSVLVDQTSVILTLSTAVAGLIACVVLAGIVFWEGGVAAICVSTALLAVPYSIYQAFQAFGPTSAEARRLRGLHSIVEVMRDAASGSKQ